MPEQPTPHVEALREEVLKKIKQDVQRAYNCRRLVTINVEKKTDEEGLAEDFEMDREFRQLPDEEYIIFEKDTDPWEALVTNPHDYIELLTEAFNILVRNGVLPKEKYTSARITELVGDYLEHEFAHHVPILDQIGMKVTYAVEFMEDVDKQLIGFRPAIHMNGPLQYGKFKDMVSAPDKLSASDQVFSQED